MIQSNSNFYSKPPKRPGIRVLGESAKQVGMTRAADAKPEAVAAGQVAFLRVLLDAREGTATIDDATADLSECFEHGGKWRGSIPSALAKRGIIRRIGDRKSDRPTRHRGYVSVWQLVDREKAQSEIERLTAWLSAVETKNPQSAATDAGETEANNTKSSTPTQGVNENAP